MVVRLLRQLVATAGPGARIPSERDLDDRLMLHVSAIESTRLERLEASGEAVLSELTLTAGDAMIVASNSGGNAVCNVVAAGARHAGVGVIAIVNRVHGPSSPSQSCSTSPTS